MNKKNGLNDFDKPFVTVALWISGLALLASAFSLYMLPEQVYIFYPFAAGGGQSKYYNIFLTLLSLVPAVIVLVSASLKKRNRLQNNFMSVILFSIMLGLCMGSVIVYGILQQFEASGTTNRVNLHGLIVTVVCFSLSMLSSLMPLLFHAPSYADKMAQKRGRELRFICILEDHWSVGAYGYCATAMISSFVPRAFCYIPLAAALLADAVFLAALTFKGEKDPPPSEERQSAE